MFINGMYRTGILMINDLTREDGSFMTFGEFNPIPDGGRPFRPPSGFSCAIAKRRKIESSYLVTFS